MTTQASDRDHARQPNLFTDDYLLYLLARASHIVSGEFHDRLKNLGVSVPQWRVLAVLSGCESATIGELARKCLHKQPTLTRIVDRLERQGLVTRVAGSRDRRQIAVSLTEDGRRRSADLVAAAKTHEQSLFAAHPDRDIEALKATLLDFIHVHQVENTADQPHVG